MTEPDYIGEPEDQAARAAQRRANARARTAGAVYAALHTAKGPNAAYFDTAAVLAFEREHPQPGGDKEDRIRRTFNVSATRYQQRLYHLIHDDEAAARRIDPQTVNRLLRLEAEHAEARRRRTQGIAA